MAWDQVVIERGSAERWVRGGGAAGFAAGFKDQRPCAVGGVVRRERKTACWLWWSLREDWREGLLAGGWQ